MARCCEAALTPSRTRQRDRDPTGNLSASSTKITLHGPCSLT